MPSLSPGVLTPTWGVLPKFYGLPKIHKTGIPLRPIVSSRGSVTYGVAKVLSRVITPLVGKSPHHIQSMGDFVSRAKRFTLQPGECLSSYDATSLFTSVPIDPALNVIKELLEKDEKLNDRIVLSVHNIIELLGFCLHNTNGTIPFLDTLVTPLADNSLSFQVYQKPTHTDQYLQWESHHNLSSMYSVIGTLTHRANLVCTTPELLKEELNHLRRALGKCNNPHWAIKRVQNKVLNNNQENTGNNNSTTNNNTSGDSNDTTNNNNQPIITTNNRPTNKAKTGQIVIPYTKGTAESIKHICGKYGTRFTSRETPP